MGSVKNKNKESRDIEKQLLATVQQYREVSQSNDLSQLREQATERYLGDQDRLPAPVGTSRAVSRDVMEVVEWAAADMARILISTDDVSTFDAFSQDDEAQAEQESDYARHVLMNQNNGFLVLQESIKNGLLHKNGVVKAWWDDSTKDVEETYTGVTAAQLVAFTEDKDVEILGQEERIEVIEQPSPIDGSLVPIPTPVFDLDIKRTVNKGRIVIRAVAPEHFYYDQRHSDIDLSDCKFTGDKERVTVSTLYEMGFPKDRIKKVNVGDEHDGLESGEYAARHGEVWDRDYESDYSSKEVWLEEYYVHHDIDGDNISEVVQVHCVADVILDWEVVDRNPYHAWTPILVPHRFDGMSMDDVAGNLEDVKTVMLRQALNNINQSIHDRPIIDEDKVRIADVISPAPNRPIRVKGSPHNAFLPKPVQNVAPGIFQAMEYIDNLRTDRTGIDKNMQALDPELLKQTTADAFSRATNLAGARKDGLVGMYAHTLWRSLMRHIHELSRKHQDIEKYVKLRNEWVTVKPLEWKDRENLTVNVGLGTNDRDLRAGQLHSVLVMQTERLVPLGLAGPKEVFNTVSKYVESLGYKNAEDFVMNPAKMPPPAPPPPDPNMLMLQLQEKIEQGKLQLEHFKAQNDANLKGQEQQLKAVITAQQNQLEYYKCQIQDSQAMVDDDRAERELQMKAAIEDEKLSQTWAQMDKGTEASPDHAVEVAQIKADADIEKEKIKSKGMVSAAKITAKTPAEKPQVIVQKPGKRKVSLTTSDGGTAKGEITESS